MPSYRPTLSGCRAKRERAQHHLEILEKDVREFFAAHPYSVTIEPDPERCRYVIRLHDPLQIPDTKWACIIGDCVHNLRAVFDYIAWELAGGDPLDTVTMFPVCDTTESFKKNANKIRRLSPEAQALIQKFQPYQGKNRRRDPHKHFLWALHALDISDKHKLLTLTVAQPIGANLRFAPPPPPIEYEVNIILDTTFIDNADVAQIKLTHFVPNMHVEAHLTFDIAFDESIGLGKRQFVIMTLKQIMSEIDFAIKLFDEKFFR